jgi:membrane associated rhomboid family serine protease
MGTADRDYFRDEERRYSGRGQIQPLTPVTKWLLIANIAIFVGDWLFFNTALIQLFAFRVEQGILGGRVWELLTFQFFHDGPAHLIFNSFSLWLFGRWVEQWWSPRRFLIFYLLCGIAGAVLYTLLVLPGVLPSLPLVGASAGIYGCLVAAAVIDPKTPIQLIFPPIVVTVKRLAQVLLGFAALMVLIAFLAPGARIYDNTGGEAAHLGGAIAGFALMRFSKLLGRRAEESAKIIRPKEFRQKKKPKPPKPPSKLRPRTHLETSTASEVDRILDKINREGMQSLTPQEQEILHKAGKSKKDR